MFTEINSIYSGYKNSNKYILPKNAKYVCQKAADTLSEILFRRYCKQLLIEKSDKVSAAFVISFFAFPFTNVDNVLTIILVFFAFYK